MSHKLTVRNGYRPKLTVHDPSSHTAFGAGLYKPTMSGMLALFWSPPATVGKRMPDRFQMISLSGLTLKVNFDRRAHSTISASNQSSQHSTPGNTFTGRILTHLQLRELESTDKYEFSMCPRSLLIMLTCTIARLLGTSFW